MDGDGRVAEHRLRPGRRNLQRLAVGRARDGILDRPEMPLDVLVIDLVIGDGRVQVRVPVDQSLPAIDLVRLEQPEKRHADSSGADRVEREPGPLPVARTAQQPQLAQDPLLVLVLPGPDPSDERVAAEVVAGLLFLLEQPPFDHRLRGDARVVGAGHPEGVVPLHPTPTDQDVLQRIVQRVPQVQRPGDIRWRDHDRVRRLVARRVGVKVPLFEPGVVPAALGVLGIVLLGKFGDAHARGPQTYFLVLKNC